MDRVQIIDCAPEYFSSFKELNVEWISKYFVMEDADFKSLDHPEAYILAPGGRIFIALLDGKPVGTSALLKVDDSTYELVKMAVNPEAQGHGIGYLLGKKAIDEARAMGAKMVYLESNTVLAPAIQLYYKLGFQKIEGRLTPYQRCNIQMELKL